MITGYLATEDILSETVGQRLISEFFGDVSLTTMRRGGNRYLQAKVDSFVQLAERSFVFVLTDLDLINCAPELRQKWFGRNFALPTKLHFRVAVREVESWLLADQAGFAEFLSVPRTRVPLDPDNLENPKRTLLQLASKAPRDLRMDIVSTRSSSVVQGFGYNARLIEFVSDLWAISDARQNSDSLDRACKRLEEARSELP